MSKFPDVYPACIDTSLPLGQALVAMFKGVEDELEGHPAGSVKIIIFGGVAVHLYTSHRVSVDVDAEIFHCDRSIDRRELEQSLGATPESFTDPCTRRVLALNYDLSFSTTLGPLHEDYLERAVRVPEFSGESPLHLMVAAPVDVIISKLGRATEQDIEGMERLLGRGYVPGLRAESTRFAGD